MPSIQDQAVQATLRHYGLSKLATTPLRRAGAGFLSGALPGAAVGGIYGGLTAAPDEDAGARALSYALKGGLTTGAANALRHGIKQYRLERSPQTLPLFEKELHDVGQALLSAPDPSPERAAALKRYAKVRELRDQAQKALTPESTYLEDLIARLRQPPEITGE